ncbi:DoxX family protein [Rhodopila sp.]|uniref:DoxX family protein n=1 Tax=Rhodopila sp. TaxID=2480087 RepID=UPI003D14E514
MNWIGLLGRFLMSAIFIQAGIGKAMAPAATMAYFAKDGLPIVGAAYALSLAVEIGGGVLLLIGYRVRLVALVLAAWCVATAMVAHYHPESREQMINFMKNLCMAGGFLQIVAFGAGRLSLGRQ